MNRVVKKKSFVWVQHSTDTRAAKLTSELAGDEKEWLFALVHDFVGARLPNQTLPTIYTLDG